MRFTRFTLILCLLFAFADHSRAQKRHAIVIGNDSYPGNALQNARNDARGVFNALSKAGYDSVLVLDANKLTLTDKVDAFADSVHPGDVALLYYAGHGMQLDGENYLVPVDFNITGENAAKEQGYSLSSVLERLTSHGATTQIVILDACRDNPFLGSRSMRGGWAGVGTSAGSFLAFGTSPGSTASDDPNSDHGLFTSSLLQYLTSSNLDIEEMLRKVREDVIRNSGGKQVPWVSSSLIGSFHVNPDLDTQAPLLDTSLLERSAASGTDGRSMMRPLPDSSSLADAAETEQIQEAMSMARGERFDKAIGILKGVLSIDPRCAVALRLLGLIFHVCGRDLMAKEAFDRAVALSGSDPRAAAYKCALEGYTDEPTARQDCDSVITAEPSADGYLAYAGALAASGNGDEAYTKATQSVNSGGSDLAYAMRGLAAQQLGRQGNGARDMAKAAQLSLQSSTW